MDSGERWIVRQLEGDRAGSAVPVLCDAFYQYPVMRHVIGPVGEDYDRRLAILVGFFVAARVLRNEPVISIADGDDEVASAIMTPPGERPAPPPLAARRDETWNVLGEEARARYEELGVRWKRVACAEPNLHLNMIGVRASHAGRGLGRRLLDAVHARSAQDPLAKGVSLTTEDADNVPLYQHLGYRIVGHTQLAEGLETWGFFRPDP